MLNEHVIFCAVFAMILVLILIVFTGLEVEPGKQDDADYPDAPGLSSLTSLIVSLVVMGVVFVFYWWMMFDFVRDNHMSGSVLINVMLLFLFLWGVFQQLPRAIYMDTNTPTIPPANEEEKATEEKKDGSSGTPLQQFSNALGLAAENSRNRQAQTSVYLTIIAITIAISLGLMYFRDTPVIIQRPYAGYSPLLTPPYGGPVPVAMPLRPPVSPLYGYPPI